MQLRFLFVKGKNDFCQSIEQFKSLFSSNVRVAFKEDTLEADHKEVSYGIQMYDVESSKETIFSLTLEAKQANDDQQVEALESAESAFRRINEQLNTFQINTIRDDISRYYGQKLYPLITEVEALLREIIYLFMLKNVGSKWLKEQSPEEVKKAILNTVEKNHQESIYPDTDALIYADFITLGWFFFSKYSLKNNYQELIGKLKDKQNLEEDKLQELINQFESKSNWERYFADKISVDELSSKWDKLYGYRNMIAHTKRIRKADFSKAMAIVDELKPAFIQCLEHMNSISMTEAESEAIEEVAEQTIAPKSVVVRGGRDNTPLLYAGLSPQINFEGLGNALMTIGLAGEKLINLDQSMPGLTSGLSKLGEALTLSVNPDISKGMIRLAESAASPISTSGVLDTLGKIAIDSSVSNAYLSAQPIIKKEDSISALGLAVEEKE